MISFASTSFLLAFLCRSFGLQVDSLWSRKHSSPISFGVEIIDLVAVRELEHLPNKSKLVGHFAPHLSGCVRGHTVSKTGCAWCGEDHPALESGPRCGLPDAPCGLSDPPRRPLKARSLRIKLVHWVRLAAAKRETSSQNSAKQNTSMPQVRLSDPACGLADTTLPSSPEAP